MRRNKIYFQLEMDEDGYPPFDVESLWVSTIDKGVGIIDNIPFFVKGIALGIELLSMMILTLSQ